ncbi:MAG TPA: hypothetical protein VNT75_03895 [Symbiobacteriaceae bacterium]|nr:hypothetical protein [Symbiobacteriaceae bacterium]
MSLSSYPAWRSVGDTLRELACLLRAAGVDFADLAAQVDSLADDPAAAADLLPSGYRIRFPLRTPRLPAADESDLEGQLQSWLADLARHLADVPLLLAAPAAAEALGQALTGELPRAWTARLGVPVFGLRQQVRGARSARAPVAFPSVPSAAPPLHWVIALGDTYHVVLPSGAPAACADRAKRELRYLLLRDLGLDAARLHLLLCAAPGGVTETEVRRALGLKGAHRAADERAYAAVARLQQVRLSLLTWDAPDGALAWERQPLSLWDVLVSEYGQACLDERSGKLAAHGSQWAFSPRPESWGMGLDAESRFLLEDLNGRKDPLSLATAVRLSLAEGDEVVLQNAEVGALAGGALDRNRLRAAARLQRLSGWEPDFSGWPPASEGDLGAASITYRRGQA